MRYLLILLVASAAISCTKKTDEKPAANADAATAEQAEASAKDAKAAPAKPNIRLRDQIAIVEKVFPAASETFTPSTAGVCRNLGQFSDSTQPTCERAYTSAGKRFQIKLTEYRKGSDKLAAAVPNEDVTGQPGAFTTFSEPAGVRGTVKRFDKGGTVILRGVIDDRNVVEIYGLKQDDTAATLALFKSINIEALRQL